MNRDDVIRWAREAGFATEEWGDGSRHVCVFNFQDSETDVTKELERFAALVAAAAKAEEREACARVCERYWSSSLGSHGTAIAIAAAIRARGQA